MPLRTRAYSSFGDESEADGEGIFNYDVHEEIGMASVYRATCRRGRLRGREVALKKLPREETEDPAQLASSTALHQALHHPCILSLLSSFSTPAGRYHVLEPFSGDTLASLLGSRTPSVLTEEELRSIVRQLADALVYLRRECVLHRDIKASNIVIADGFRVKLSGFGLATRLPGDHARTTTFCGSPNYVAPEILSRSSYSFAVDLWSLGCLMLTCLTGVAAFEAPSVPEIFDKIKHGEYSLPESTSSEAADLVSSLLQVDPAKRIPLEDILTHPFLHISFPVRALSSLAARSPALVQPYPKDNPLQHHIKRSRYPDTLSKGAPSRRLPVGTAFSNTKHVAPFSGNPRRLLSDELPRPSSRPVFVSGKRASSAPQSAAAASSSDVTGLAGKSSPARTFSDLFTPALNPDNASMTSSDTADSEHPCDEVRRESPHVADDKRAAGIPRTGNGIVDEENARIVDSPVARLSEHDPAIERAQATPPKPSAQLASAFCVNKGRLAPLSTAHLAPQTLKVAQGQLVILSSHSLLVDLREGERRKGKEGREVLLIESDGREIRVYGAPHLSTPCCLVEPVATYTFTALPAKYLALYEEAARLVTQLKQRTPRLTYYVDGVRCTLMANEPLGDIELLFPSGDKTEKQKSRMRIRLRRTTRYLEVSRNVPATNETGAEERTRKSFITTDDAYTLAQKDWASLDVTEQAGLAQLADFLEVCRAVEAVSPGKLVAGTEERSRRAVSASAHSEETAVQAEKPSLATSGALSEPPREHLDRLDCEDASPGYVNHTFANAMESTGGPSASTYCARLPSRFLKHIGWCIQTSSRDGAVYKIMFHDGAELEVNQGADVVRFCNDVGAIQSWKYGEALQEPAATPRMAAFHSFVRLFAEQ